MPPRIGYWNDGGATAASPISVSMSGGEESDLIIREIWNDKDAAFGDTQTARNVHLVLGASVAGSAYASEGRPILDERWTRARVTHYLSPTGETTVGSTGTMPFGVHAEIPINDLPPQHGVRISLRIVAPGFATAAPVKLKIFVDGNRASSPLAQFVGLPLGSAVVPADRLNVRSLLRGSEVTADDSDTVAVSHGQVVVDGHEITFPAESATFDLNDSAAVALAAGEFYRVTLSRDADAGLTVTKGLKNDATAYPDPPADEVFVRSLTVASADGIAVTVSPASLTGSPTFTEFHVRPGVGLSVIVSGGDAISSTDLRPRLSHETDVAVIAESVNRIWLLADGSMISTLTDAEPEFGAGLLALATTDATTVTNVEEDVKRFAHRALTIEHIEFTPYRQVFSTLAGTAFGVALAYVYQDLEIEAVEANLTDADASWTAGSIIVDVFTFAPGVAVPYPEGAAGGVSLFTSSATDDHRPTFPFDATDLRAVSIDHEVRRLVKGTRLLLAVTSTIAAPAPEFDQELRVVVLGRRYR